MALSELWFLLIAVLFVGFMFLEGFDFGVGMGSKFLAKNDAERQMLNNAIGPTWAGNEVWLITAGAQCLQLSRIGTQHYLAGIIYHSSYSSLR